MYEVYGFEDKTGVGRFRIGFGKWDRFRTWDRFLGYGIIFGTWCQIYGADFHEDHLLSCSCS